MCRSLSGHVILRVERQLKGHTGEEEKEPCPDFGSDLDTAYSFSKHSYASSTIHSGKRNVAEAAAAQEVFAVLDEQEREATELQRLEAEDKQWLAQFESEARQTRSNSRKA